LADAAKKAGVPIHPLRLISELQKILTPDVTVCSDMGSFSMYLSRYLFSFRARQFLITNGQQTLGVALPWAIAATIVRPHEKVLSISGDGGFLFSANELETAVRLNSHLVHMIWIDGHYGYGWNAGAIEIRTHFRSRFWSGQLREVRRSIRRDRIPNR
jgi:acetolactate synthase I/II/III large subunit